MARYRIRGDVLRADTRALTVLKQFEGLSDVTNALDITRVLAASGSVAVDPTDFGITEISDLYLFSDSPVLVTLDGISSGQLEVDEFLLLRGTQLTGLTILNPLAGSATVRLLFGGD